VALDAVLSERGARLPAQTVDLSASGVLVRVAVSDLAQFGASPLPALSEALGEGFDLTFPRAQVRTRGELIRLAWKPGDAEGYYVGCRFAMPLARADLAGLGLPPHECGPESGVQALPADLMPLRQCRRTPMSLEILDLSDRTGTPVYAGPLLGVNDGALATDLPAADPTEVAARLGGHAFRVRVRLERSAALWAERAYLLAVRLPDPPQEGVSIVVLASSAPPLAVRRRMSRAAAVPAAEPAGITSAAAARRTP
jgi:hypothetical protein